MNHINKITFILFAYLSIQSTQTSTKPSPTDEIVFSLSITDFVTKDERQFVTINGVTSKLTIKEIKEKISKDPKVTLQKDLNDYALSIAYAKNKKEKDFDNNKTLEECGIDQYNHHLNFSEKPTFSVTIDATLLQSIKIENKLVIEDLTKDTTIKELKERIKNKPNINLSYSMDCYYLGTANKTFSSEDNTLGHYGITNQTKIYFSENTTKIRKKGTFSVTAKLVINDENYERNINQLQSTTTIKELKEKLWKA